MHCSLTGLGGRVHPVFVLLLISFSLNFLFKRKKKLFLGNSHYFSRKHDSLMERGFLLLCVLNCMQKKGYSTVHYNAQGYSAGMAHKDIKLLWESFTCSNHSICNIQQHPNRLYERHRYFALCPSSVLWSTAGKAWDAVHEQDVNSQGSMNR